MMSDKMNGFIKSISVFLLPMFFLMSCGDENIKVSSGYLDSDIREVVVDTCSVSLSTIMSDSIVTSGTGEAFVGKYNDACFGAIKTVGYFSFNLPDYSIQSADVITESTVFDSLILVLNSTKNYYGDTLQTLRFSVFRLTEKIELNESDYLSNKASFKYDSLMCLAKISVKLKPSSARKYSIRLPDDMGKDLLGEYVSQSDLTSDQDLFEKYFKGIVLVPENVNNVIAGFSVSDSLAAIKLYCHNVDLKKVNYVFTFIANSAKQFNQIIHDKRGTAFENLESNVEVPASKTGNLSFVQGITGMSTIIDFPSLKYFSQLGDYVKVSEAVLTIKPLKKSYPAEYPLPDSLSIVVISNMDEDIVSGSVFFQKDEVFKDRDLYQGTITSFVNDQLGSLNIDKKRIKLSIGPNSNSKLRRIVIGDNAHVDGNVVLKIKLLIYNVE